MSTVLKDTDVNSLQNIDTKHVPGIMPDHWIREQALENDMISPFSEKQNREKNGEKIISY